MKLLKKSNKNLMKMQKSVTFIKTVEYKNVKDKWYSKVREYCHYAREYGSTADTICNLKYSVSKKSYIGFHNGSNYDYHFIIKELAEEFEKENTYLGENKEKYMTFTVPIEKELKRIFKKLRRN